MTTQIPFTQVLGLKVVCNCGHDVYFEPVAALAASLPPGVEPTAWPVPEPPGYLPGPADQQDYEGYCAYCGWEFLITGSVSASVPPWTKVP